MNTITLPDGYNGHTVECDATPIAEDGNMVKLRVTGSSYLFTWVRREEWEAKKGEMSNTDYWPEPWLDKWTINAPSLYRPGERTTITERVYSPGVGCVVSRDLRFDTKAEAESWIVALYRKGKPE